MIEVSSNKKNQEITFASEASKKFWENLHFFKSSLAYVKSHYLFSVLQNDVNCILGSEKGGPGPPGPPL